MLIGPILIAGLLPLQLTMHHLEEWHHAAFSYVQIANDSANLIGLPNLRNKFPIQVDNQELLLRDPNPDDKPLTRRKTYVIQFLRQMRTFAK